MRLYGFRKLSLQRLLIKLINIKIKNLPSNNKHLLEFFKGSPDLEELKKFPVDELRLVYAERCTLSVIQQGEKRKRARPNSFTEIPPGRE